MIELRFSGWAICRLATNPDPYDDPRGTRSGFQQFAYAGEPDLDRIIWLNDPPFQRSHTPRAGVAVNQVTVDGAVIDDHALMGARIDLIDHPVFEGRNGVIATDAAEPIYPFHVAVTKDDLRLTRNRSPASPDYPYPEYLPFAAGTFRELPDLPEAIGQIDHNIAYPQRLADLQAELASATDDTRPGLEERIAVLTTMQPPRANLPFAMRWTLDLNDPPRVQAGSIAGTGIDLDPAIKWPVDLWFGGYDRDGQSFFAAGTIALASEGDSA